jgi:hypothetical protein
MSRKHYAAIAREIAFRIHQHQEHPHLTDAQRLAAVMAIETVALDLADYFATDNPNFDYDRFTGACGIHTP